MWGLPVLVSARPWASDLPPELALAARVETDLVVLAGSAGAGPRGRYGFAGVPACVTELAPAPGALARAFDDRPPDMLRLVLLGYEMGAPEVYLPAVAPPRGQPAGLALDLSAALVVDHQARTFAVVGQPGQHADLLRRCIEQPVEQPTREPVLATGAAQLVPSVSDREHTRRIHAVLDHIARGDIYQANLTRRLTLTGALDAPALLCRLAERNPVAHAAYLRAGGIEILSNSMETLLTYDPTSRTAASFPIKGTIARGEDGASRRLKADPKERAEHVMIVDLVRNDLGKVAAAGSVHVPDLMRAEPYRGVWHLVSTVQATLAPRHSVGQLVAALFPGGSITGAPKRRAVEILRALEAEPRGVYTGSLGVITPSGRLSLSLLIRTLVRDRAGWSLSVGGGIVADSTPAREIAETWEKVAVFREVLARATTMIEKQRGHTRRPTQAPHANRRAHRGPRRQSSERRPPST